MRNLFSLVAILSVSVWLSASSAHAQFMNPGLNAMNIEISGNMQRSASRSNSSEEDATEVPQETVQATLNYSVSKKRREQNLASFINKAKQADVNSGNQLAVLLSSTDVLGQIDQAIRPMGLRSDNVADAYTVWWVSAWSAANISNVSSNQSMYTAVKQQASSALLSTTQFASLNDSQKQEMAEAMLLQAAMIDAHIDEAASSPTQQAALAKAVNQGAKKMGLDLTTMDLTEQGFVPRSGGRSDAGDVNAPGEEGNALAANDNAIAGESDTGKLALYGVGGAALLAGMFALGKSFGGKG